MIFIFAISSIDHQKIIQLVHCKMYLLCFSTLLLYLAVNWTKLTTILASEPDHQCIRSKDKLLPRLNDHHNQLDVTLL